jgi:hypothetical protein
MRHKTYEADKDGKIYIYPSLDVAGKKRPALSRYSLGN